GWYGLRREHFLFDVPQRDRHTGEVGVVMDPWGFRDLLGKSVSLSLIGYQRPGNGDECVARPLDERDEYRMMRTSYYCASNFPVAKQLGNAFRLQRKALLVDGRGRVDRKNKSRICWFRIAIRKSIGGENQRARRKQRSALCSDLLHHRSGAI